MTITVINLGASEIQSDSLTEEEPYNSTTTGTSVPHTHKHHLSTGSEVAVIVVSIIFSLFVLAGAILYFRKQQKRRATLRRWDTFSEPLVETRVQINSF